MGAAHCCQVATCKPVSNSPIQDAAVPSKICDAKSETQAPGALKPIMKQTEWMQIRNVQNFRKFIHEQFRSPGEAWDSIMAGVWLGGGRLQQDLFAKRMVDLGFDGDALGIFGVMDEDGKGLTREQFIKIMTGRGSAFTSGGSPVPAAPKDGGVFNKTASENMSSVASEPVISEGRGHSKGRGHSGARETSPKCSKRDNSPKESKKNGNASLSPKDSRRFSDSSIASVHSRKEISGSSESLSTAGSTPSFKVKRVSFAEPAFT
eukprot:gnl/MRDRNA2_/MRDRNA2_142229_c0_seq1.p1 gnl/MRDRNA2_/MRDRNA2_142229_c0~~gnl/MRDRNA2_/MRDRNA2_142229_c0_seq1.p1  ORF type:complete len:263 (+),score=49.45 gnl/MRDRNA2_/MRDRNA2_142229_c0_seq1:98-886(+)